MAVSLFRLKNKMKFVIVKLEDGELRIEYNPAKYNAETEAAFQDAINGGRPVGSLAKLMSELITGWDLVETDENPEKVPVSEAVLNGLGMDVLNAFAEAILLDMKPGEK